MPSAPAQQTSEGLCLGTRNADDSVTAVAITAGTPVSTHSYAPTNGQLTLKFALNMSGDGTYQIYRVDARGVAQSQGAAVAITGGTEARATIQNPMNTPYFVQLSLTAGSGTCYAEVDGQGARQ